MPVKILYNSSSEDGFIPEYKTEESSGMDVRAYLPNTDGVKIGPGKVKLIPTGLKFQIPKGFELQCRSRSGLALNNSIFVLNSPGTIDSDYTGEVGVVLANFGDSVFVVKHGDRVAQLVLASVTRAKLAFSETLHETVRGSKGFGSTGIK